MYATGQNRHLKTNALSPSPPLKTEKADSYNGGKERCANLEVSDGVVSIIPQRVRACVVVLRLTLPHDADGKPVACFHLGTFTARLCDEHAQMLILELEAVFEGGLAKKRDGLTAVSSKKAPVK
jgi:hypothetical protein